jgi:hypothetical protein
MADYDNPRIGSHEIRIFLLTLCPVFERPLTEIHLDNRFCDNLRPKSLTTSPDQFILHDCLPVEWRLTSVHGTCPSSLDQSHHLGTQESFPPAARSILHFISAYTGREHLHQ